MNHLVKAIDDREADAHYCFPVSIVKNAEHTQCACTAARLCVAHNMYQLKRHYRRALIRCHLHHTLVLSCHCVNSYTKMASRHTGLREAPVSCPPTMPDPNPMAVFENSNTLGPGDEITKAELKREADRQTLFQKVANDILGSPNGYRQVQVLIIRWDESIDQFKGHTKEVCISRLV
jgi:hypothetical protein